MRPLQNLHTLKADMEQKGWVVDSFRFNFKKIDYIVLVMLFGPDERKDQYALVQLDFLNAKNFNHHLLVSANAGGIMLSAEELRRFFGIHYAENLGDILQQFTNLLGYHIPEKVYNTKSKNERQAIVHALSKKDGEEANKVYCYAVKRNPSIPDAATGTCRQLKRSIYNDNKTRLLRGSLYQKLGKDPTISFCYSEDPEKELADERIIANWSKKQQPVSI